MLGWWANKTKGYRLKDLENEKLITFRYVKFYKDNTLSKLVCLNPGLIQLTTEEINEFINTATYPETDQARQVLIYNPSSESKVETQLEEAIQPSDNKSVNTPREELQYPSLAPPAATTNTQMLLDSPPAPQKSTK